MGQKTSLVIGIARKDGIVAAERGGQAHKVLTIELRDILHVLPREGAARGEVL